MLTGLYCLGIPILPSHWTHSLLRKLLNCARAGVRLSGKIMLKGTRRLILTFRPTLSTQWAPFALARTRLPTSLWREAMVPTTVSVVLLVSMFTARCNVNDLLLNTTLSLSFYCLTLSFVVTRSLVKRCLALVLAASRIIRTFPLNTRRTLREFVSNLPLPSCETRPRTLTFVCIVTTLMTPKLLLYLPCRL